MSATEITIKIPHWAEVQCKLVKWMSGWVDDLIEKHQTLPWKGGHDEALFARTLPAFYLATGYKPALLFAESLADKLIATENGEACDCFLTPEDRTSFHDRSTSPKWHGYYADWSCLCHGPENYTWFLAPLALVSSNEKYRVALLDVAEHLGNWADGVPEWYDWSKNAFRSIHLGTKVVRDYVPYQYDSQTHFRLVTLALNAFAVSQDEKYLDLVEEWLLRWSEEINATGQVPHALYEDRAESYGEFYRTSAQPIQHEYCHLALDLCRLRPNDVLIQSVRRQLDNPEVFAQWDTSLVYSKYRWLTGDCELDNNLLDESAGDLENSDTLPGFALMIDHQNVTGFGDNFGYVTVRDGKSIASDNRSVARLMTAWQISGDTRYLDAALDLAFMRFWASWYLWDGREFGCRGSWTGRNGVAMHNLIPALNMSMTGGTGMVQGELPWAEFVFRTSEGWGVPEAVATLVDYSKHTLTIINSRASSVEIQIKHQRKDDAILCINGDWTNVTLESGEQWQLSI